MAGPYRERVPFREVRARVPLHVLALHFRGDFHAYQERLAVLEHVVFLLHFKIFEIQQPIRRRRISHFAIIVDDRVYGTSCQEVSGYVARHFLQVRIRTRLV